MNKSLKRPESVPQGDNPPYLAGQGGRTRTYSSHHPETNAPPTSVRVRHPHAGWGNWVNPATYTTLEVIDMTDAYARHSDPETSKSAAERMRLSNMERIVFDVIKKLRGATTHEIADHTGISLVTVSPRIRPLVRKGMIQDSGKKRAGDSGRKSIVWGLINPPCNADPDEEE